MKVELGEKLFEFSNKQDWVDRAPKAWIERVEHNAKCALREIDRQIHILKEKKEEPVAIYISRDVMADIIYSRSTELFRGSQDDFTIFGIPAYQVLHNNHLKVVI